MTIIDQINTEFIRVIGKTDDDYTLTASSDSKPGDVTVQSSNEDDEEIIFRAADLLSVLQALPDGCPLEEGIDGSLWEALFELESYGLTDALVYVKEHHSS